MALRDLLVYVDQSKHASERLRLAADLARRHQSRLTALYIRELSPAQRHEESIAELGQGSAEAIIHTNRKIRKSIEEAAERLRSALQDVEREHGLEVEWRCLDGIATTLVPQHARFADLCIVSQDTPAVATATGYSLSEQLLFVTGRPVVFVPPQESFSSLGRHFGSLEF